jgi:HlyD family secretion protein
MLSEPTPDAQPSIQPKVSDESRQATLSPPKMPSGGIGVLAGIGIGIAITLGGMTLMARSNKQSPAASPQEKVAKGSQQSVSVASAQVMSIAQTFAVQGSVEARNWVSVIPKATGVQIKSIAVEEGQAVQKGETIAVLDSSVQRDQLNQANAQVQSAQAQLSAAQTQLNSTKAQVLGAKAQLTSAESAVVQQQAKLSQQQATLNEAESNRRRYVTLAGQGAISTQELESRKTAAATARAGINVSQSDINSASAGVRNAIAQVAQANAGVSNARAGVKQAEANVQNAIARQQELETQLGQASLVQAPASGVIAKKNARVGDLTGTTPLFSIIQNASVELQAKVPQTLLSKVKIGAAASVTSASDRRLNLKGTVREIDPVVDGKTRQATVKIDLPPNAALKPGMFLQAAIAFNRASSLAIPSEALVPQANGQMIVYVLGADNTVKAQPIEIGDPAKGRVAVKSGLKVGERVVVAGAGFVKDGDRVNVVP